MEADQRALEHVLRWHLRFQQQFAADDVVKLLFQAVLGMDHLLADRAAFRWALEAEWAGLGRPLPQERLVEPVHPGRRMVRLNLRPAKAAHIPGLEIVPFLSQQPLLEGSRVELERTAQWSVQLARRERVPLSASRLEAVWATALRHGHPPGHSRAYQKEACPAYRLVHDVRHKEFVRMLTNAWG